MSVEGGHCVPDARCARGDVPSGSTAKSGRMTHPAMLAQALSAPHAWVAASSGGLSGGALSCQVFRVLDSVQLIVPGNAPLQILCKWINTVMCAG